MSAIMKLIPAIYVSDHMMQWLYLQTWDLDGKEGRGDVKRTDNPLKAHRFKSKAEAMAAWREQSKKFPLRPDGMPNRPLTAYHAEILEVP